MSDKPLDAFHYHEALDRTSMIMDILGDCLLDHRAIQANPAWVHQVNKAHKALFDLYQMIGSSEEWDGSK